MPSTTGAHQWDSRVPCSGERSGIVKPTLSNFAKGVEDGFVKWGYAGKNAKGVTEGMSVDDVRWFLKYLGEITDRQLEAALRSSGAEDQDVSCFAQAIRGRIRQLQQISPAVI